MNSSEVQTLTTILQAQPHLVFAVLVGSRAKGSERPDSDWDIALLWSRDLDWFAMLGQTETLRHQLAHGLGVAADAVDLIDLSRANLAMRAR